MNHNVLGVYVRFSSAPNASIDERKREQKHKKEFEEYLWGENRDGGLSSLLAQLKSEDYGTDVKLILLQFMVDPVKSWPLPTKDVENYRPKEQAIGVWIMIDENSYFKKSTLDRQKYVKEEIVKRLQVVGSRFAARKLDADIEQLITDVDKLL